MTYNISDYQKKESLRDEIEADEDFIEDEELSEAEENEPNKEEKK